MLDTFAYVLRSSLVLLQKVTTIIGLYLSQNQIQHCILQINSFLTISILFLWHKF